MAVEVSRLTLDTTKLERDTVYCMGYVHGDRNQLGMRVPYWLDVLDGAMETDPRIPAHVAHSEWTPGDWHTGYPGSTHGGPLFAWLDDMGARLASMAFPPGHWAVTKESLVRYLLPVQPHTTLTAQGALVRLDGSVPHPDADGHLSPTAEGLELVTQARLLLPGGRPAVTAEGRYVPMPASMRRRALLHLGGDRIHA